MEGDVGKIVGKATLERLIKDTIASNGTRVSPRTEGGECLYRGADGALCLIAEVLVNKLDFAYDASWEGREPPSLLKDLGFDSAAAETARRWQDDPTRPAVKWVTLLA
jgi:hypothetical protein